ncbi:hypothetical protein [Ilumatobacter sp.]|uniref:hypothetical protein n=1 Tax=Ilumatobacter sp. TaxID=1967498 RepID=UPI003B5190F2
MVGDEADGAHGAGGDATGRRAAPDPDAVSDPDAPPGTAPDGAAAWERIDWIACAVIVAAAFVLVGLHARAYPTLSPIDELQHIDYVFEAGRFEVPRINDRVGDEAMREAACRSVDSPNYVGPPCGLDAYLPDEFQERGVNTAATQFPPYYTATGLISRAVAATGVVDSQVTAARMVGALWAGAAWSVIWYVLAVLGIPRPNRAIVVALLMATPLTLFHAATVNADAILLLTGAVVTLATVQFERRRLNGWLVLLVYGATFFVEATNVLVVAACGTYLLARVTFGSGAWTLRRALPVLVLPAILVLRLRIARPLHRALFPPSPREVTAPMFTERRVDGVDWDRVLQQIDATFTPVARAYNPPFLRSQITYALIGLTNWLLIATMFVTAVGLVAHRRTVWAARVTMVALLAAGPFYTFSFAYFSGSDFPAPGRFGLPLIALIAVAASAALDTRPARLVAGTLAAISMAYTVWLLLTP